MENKSCIYGSFIGMMILIVLVRPITMKPRIEDKELQGIKTKAKNEHQKIMDPLSISSISMQAKLHKLNVNNDDGLLNSKTSQTKISNTDAVYGDLMNEKVVYNYQNNQNMEKPVAHQLIDPVMSPLIRTLTSGKFMTSIPQGYGDSEMYLFQRMDPLLRPDKQGLQSNVRAVEKPQTDDLFKVERIFDRLQISNFSRNHLRAPSLEIQDNLKTLVLNWLRQNKSNVNQQEHIGFSIKNIYNQTDRTSQLHKLQTTEYPTTIPTTIYPTKTATTVDLTTNLSKEFPTTFPMVAFPTKSPTTAFPTSAYHTTISTTVYPKTIPTTVYSTKNPTKVYPTTTPTTVYQSKTPTTVIPSKTPTAVYFTTMPTTVVSSTTPTTVFPSKLPTTVFKTKIPTTMYSTKITTTVYSTMISTTMYPKTTLTTLNPARKFVLRTSKLPKTASNPTSISMARNVHNAQDVSTQKYIFRTDLPAIITNQAESNTTAGSNIESGVYSYYTTNRETGYHTKTDNKPSERTIRTISPLPTISTSSAHLHVNSTHRQNNAYIETKEVKTKDVVQQLYKTAKGNQNDMVDRKSKESPAPEFKETLTRNANFDYGARNIIPGLYRQKDYLKRLSVEHQQPSKIFPKQFPLAYSKRLTNDLKETAVGKHRMEPLADTELLRAIHDKHRHNNKTFQRIKESQTKRKSSDENNSITKVMVLPKSSKASTAVDIEDLLINYYQKGNKYNLFSRSEIEQQTNKDHESKLDNENQQIFQHSDNGFNSKHPAYKMGDKKNVRPVIKQSRNKGLPVAILEFIYDRESTVLKDFHAKPHKEPLQVTMKQKHLQPNVEVRTSPSSARVYSNVEQNISEQKLKSRDDYNIKQKHAQPKVDVRTIPLSARVYSNVEQNLSEQKLKSRDDYNIKHGIELLNKLFYSGFK